MCCVVSDTEWLDSELASVVRSAMADDSDVLLAIAPQSVNSDLKRDIAPQLAILKRQTRQALQQIISQHTQHAHTLKSLSRRTVTHLCIPCGCSVGVRGGQMSE